MRLLVIIVALAWGGQALASDGAEASIAGAAASGPVAELAGEVVTTSTAPLPNGVTVSFGRAVDLDGRPMYADRRGSSGTISSVRFSDRPVAVVSRSPVINLDAASPLRGARMTSRYGYRRNPVTGMWAQHAGVDLAIPMGTPVYASMAGSVSRADWAGGYGLLVELNHGQGVQTRYAHLSRLAVHPGETVKKGELIGYVGSTGRSTGPHLHYETRVNGAAVDPTRF